ncbi:hypothetical protein [Nonomuraea jiangxiensis]|uniref:GDSL-like Lipase/Acylhydrolase family protein n=1 Tax=Nonomuraea jiangxiensis TaxID=633440 RepID=A0A1G9QBA5_9ACTN|nr:hypothetical protein [Nonomuraea jiangxiensis]SDM07747.1 hypothetical protein SAMN05421869_135101 [Nonomuraea jiangxiensis]
MRPPRRLWRRLTHWWAILIGLVTVLAAITVISTPAGANGSIFPTTRPTIRPTLQPPPPTFPPPTFRPPSPTPTDPSTCTGFCVPRIPLKMVVVGDSYTSGEGATTNHQYVRMVDGSEDWRHQSGYAPPHLAWSYLEATYHNSQYTVEPDKIRTEWNGDRLYFNASSGAEVRHLKEVQFEDEDHTDIREVKNVAQLAGVPRDTNIVYFGLGGNDADFGPLMKTMLMAYYSTLLTDNYIDSRRAQARAVHLKVQQLLQTMGQVSANVEQGLVNVKDATDHAEIIVALYPLAVKPSGNTTYKHIGGPAMDQLYPYIVAVNKAIQDAVQRFRARFPQVQVHVFDPNTAGPNGTSVVAGHEIGQPDSYFNGVIARNDLLRQGRIFNGLQESFHPNERGSVAIGRALATWMAERFSGFFPNGPDFNRVVTNAQASADDPDAEREFDEWAVENTDKLCDGASIDSICHYIDTDGDISVPLEVLLNPIPLAPVPGAPTVGGPGGGAPGGGVSTSTWISATYSSAPSGVPPDGGIGNTATGDPCALTAVDPYQRTVAVSTSVLRGGNLQTPIELTWIHFNRTVDDDPCVKGEKVDPEALREQGEAWLNGGPLPE